MNDFRDEHDDQVYTFKDIAKKIEENL